MSNAFDRIYKDDKRLQEIDSKISLLIEEISSLINERGATALIQKKREEKGKLEDERDRDYFSKFKCPAKRCSLDAGYKHCGICGFSAS